MIHNKLVPEFAIQDLDKSIHFYESILGFNIEYKREDEGFAFLSNQGSQIMLDQMNKGRDWKTGEMEVPFGRGINIQMDVTNLQEVLDSLSENSIDLFMEPEEKTYLTEKGDVTVRQFLVQDPDGYLLRFAQEIN